MVTIAVALRANLAMRFFFEDIIKAERGNLGGTATNAPMGRAIFSHENQAVYCS
jgi:hypothetical protein